MTSDVAKTDTGLTARWPDRAGRRALRCYAKQALPVRAHVWVRWLSAPFREVEAWLPPAGSILEIGCGHGLFATYAALARPGRVVRGSDIDADKIAVAAAAVTGAGERVRFEVAESGAVPAGPWDAIVVLDVLYLLPREAQHRLLQECVSRLAPGGRLLVKEMAETPRWKAWWNRTQETLSVSVLRITEQDDPGADTHRFTFVPTDELRGWLHDAGLTTEVMALDRRRLHPHQLVIGVRPVDPGSPIDQPVT